MAHGGYSQVGSKTKYGNKSGGNSSYAPDGAKPGYDQAGSGSTYTKSGQPSNMEHVAPGQGTEYYKRDRFEACDSINGAPDAAERKFSNKYRKISLPVQEDEKNIY